MSISAVLLDIDALPSPSASSDIVTIEPLECASPLTERALRYQRRDALRATQDVVAPISPHGTVRSNAILQKIVPAKFPNLYCSNITFTPQRNAPVPGKLHEHSMTATIPRVTTTLMAEQSPFTTCSMCPPRDFSPPAPLRAFRSMSSLTTSAAKNPSKAASTSMDKTMAASPSAAKNPSKTASASMEKTMAAPPSTSATHPPLSTSPVASTAFRDISGSGTGRTRGVRP